MMIQSTTNCIQYSNRQGYSSATGRLNSVVRRAKPVRRAATIAESGALWAGEGARRDRLATPARTDIVGNRQALSSAVQERRTWIVEQLAYPDQNVGPESTFH